MAERRELEYDTDDVASDRDLDETYQDNPERDEDREQLYALREMHIAALSRLFMELGVPEVFNELTKNELLVRKERLQNHFAEMERAHGLYRQVCILSSDDIYSDMETQLMRNLSKIGDRLDEQIGNEPISMLQAPALANSTMQPNSTAIIRVETARPPQIGKFNGNPADWPAFRDLFIAEVHNRDFAPVTKLLFLQEACVEEAADTLGPWQPTNDNFQIAWDSMMASFNDEYHVVQGRIGKMSAVPRAERETFTTLRANYDALNSTTRQLDAMNDLPAMWDQLWIHMSRQRLPKSTLDAWEQYRTRHGHTRLPTLGEYKRFLDTRSKGRREFEHEINGFVPNTSGGKMRQETGGNHHRPYDRNASHRQHDKNASPRPGRTPQPSHGAHSYEPRKEIRYGSGGPTACIMTGCTQTHYLGQCEHFRGLSLDQRVTTTQQNRLCRCCLMPGHMAFACTRSGCAKCPEAKSKHHFRLCPKTTNDAKPAAQMARKESNPFERK